MTRRAFLRLVGSTALTAVAFVAVPTLAPALPVIAPRWRERRVFFISPTREPDVIRWSFREGAGPARGYPSLEAAFEATEPGDILWIRG